MPRRPAAPKAVQDMVSARVIPGPSLRTCLPTWATITAAKPSTAPNTAPTSMVATMVEATPDSPIAMVTPRATSIAVRAAAAPALVPKVNNASPTPTAMVAPISMARLMIFFLASSTLSANSRNAAATVSAAAAVAGSPALASPSYFFQKLANALIASPVLGAAVTSFAPAVAVAAAARQSFPHCS